MMLRDAGGLIGVKGNAKSHSSDIRRYVVHLKINSSTFLNYIANCAHWLILIRQKRTSQMLPHWVTGTFEYCIIFNLLPLLLGKSCFSLNKFFRVCIHGSPESRFYHFDLLLLLLFVHLHFWLVAKAEFLLRLLDHLNRATLLHGILKKMIIHASPWKKLSGNKS